MGIPLLQKTGKLLQQKHLEMATRMQPAKVCRNANMVVLSVNANGIKTRQLTS